MTAKTMILGIEKHLQTELLEIAYEESGPASGEAIILLHGWPDSLRCWDSVVPELAKAGYRCLVPSLRGFGKTRFLDPLTRRSAQATALAQDLLGFADALGLERFVAVGHDWGAFAVYLVAANWPERVERLVALSVGYGINNPNQRLALPQTRQFWYQWFLQTEQAQLLLEQDRASFCRFIWQTWSPAEAFDEAAFAAAAPAWDNPDWLALTLHYYRHRWGRVLGDPRYDALEVSRLFPPVIKVPAKLLHGLADTCLLPASSEGKEALFGAGYERILLPGVGHFPQRENPEAVLRAILD
jgi:pimeloyl-ACP methyl ester carboxylesterase